MLDNGNGKTTSLPVLDRPDSALLLQYKTLASFFLLLPSQLSSIFPRLSLLLPTYFTKIFMKG